MSQLVINSVPGFVDLADANIEANDVLTDDALVKISQNAKFSAVRYERIFMGFYVHGNTVGAPVSPVDGYAYSQDEVTYDFDMFHTRAADGSFVSGQATPPGVIFSQPANLYWFSVDVDDDTGAVFSQVSYYKQGGAETITNNGILKVYANCQRQSVNTAS